MTYIYCLILHFSFIIGPAELTPPRLPRSAARRTGISLLETVLATAILAAALAALGHQTFVGVRAAARMELETKAALLCQSRMETLLLQNAPATTVQNQPVPEEPGWLWSAELSPASELASLQWLTIRVFRPGSQESLSRHQLSRLIPAGSNPETGAASQFSRSVGAVQ